MRGLKDKTIIVAGGGTGIGAATALRLGAEGAKILIGDFNLDAANEVAERVNTKGGKAVARQFDVRDSESIEALLDHALLLGGALHGVHVNVANMALLEQDRDVVATDLSVFDDTLDVNLRGHVRITKLAVPH